MKSSSPCLTSLSAKKMPTTRPPCRSDLSHWACTFGSVAWLCSEANPRPRMLMLPAFGSSQPSSKMSSRTSRAAPRRSLPGDSCTSSCSTKSLPAKTPHPCTGDGATKTEKECRTGTKPAAAISFSSVSPSVLASHGPSAVSVAIPAGASADAALRHRCSCRRPSWGPPPPPCRKAKPHPTSGLRGHRRLAAAQPEPAAAAAAAATAAAAGAPTLPPTTAAATAVATTAPVLEDAPATTTMEAAAVPAEPEAPVAGNDSRTQPDGQKLAVMVGLGVVVLGLAVWRLNRPQAV
mmetsp:Transcript_3122/g.12134  ORF Transcript_3122/g.12134 Transcript_3122/m.12134 type:complete len:292 (+) Transcript_3122:263-1138(+)